MAVFTRLAATTDIAPGSMKSYTINNVSILLCNVDGTFYAVADECSHDSAPISTGHIHDDEITCPRHQARFNVRDGSVQAPPAVVPIDTFPVKVEGTDIYVEID